MPVVHFHLVEGRTSAAQDAELLRAASQFYAEVLEAPPERIRAFITAYPPGRCAVGGEIVGEHGAHAPLFECIVLAGRPAELRQRLLTGFTDLLERILGVPRGLIRGCCHQIAPEDWAIGGVQASVLRAAEIDARAQVARVGGGR